MFTGKINPIRTILTAATAGLRSDSAQKDSSNNQNAGQSPEREPTEEEFRKAAEILNDSDEFKKNGIHCVLIRVEEKFALSVRNTKNEQIRLIPGSEIYRTIFTVHATARNRHGRILDRRI